MFIVKNRKVFYAISITLITLSLAALITWGVVLGIDFKGGSVMQFSYPNGRPDVELVKVGLNKLSFADTIKELRSVGDDAYVVKLRSVTDKERIALQDVVSIGSSTAEIVSFNSIGPVLCQEAAKKSLIAIILVLVCIIAFITFAFRKVSEPVPSWKYGLFAVVALFHDVFIPIGVFSILGHYLGYEVDTLFVTAMLVVLGFSVHDTIVVYDRVRENLKENNHTKDRKSFAEVVGQSIRQTIVRSVNTSLSVLFAAVALYFFGPSSTQNFALVLIMGLFFGTYSSIFIASNLLVTAEGSDK